jgi:hypothetical protein
VSGDLRDVFTHYTALSYVWGSAEKVETIWVNDKPLKITASLFSALHDLRGETRSFILWADGICINQDDDKEKGVQNRLTGRIYAEASNTIFYLGLGNPNGKESQCLLEIRDGRKHAGVDTLFSICQKEWFARVWVFQELVFAPDPWVQWGRARAKWAAVLERGFSSYLNVSGKTLPRCSELSQSNTYTLRNCPASACTSKEGPRCV